MPVAAPGAEYIHKALGKTPDGRWALWTLRQDRDGQLVDDLQSLPKDWKPTSEWEREQAKTPSKFLWAWDYVYEMDEEGKPKLDEDNNLIPRIEPNGQPMRRLRMVEQQVDAKGQAVGAATMRVVGTEAEAPPQEPPTPPEPPFPEGEGKTATDDIREQAAALLEKTGLPVNAENLRALLAKHGWTD